MKIKTLKQVLPFLHEHKYDTQLYIVSLLLQPLCRQLFLPEVLSFCLSHLGILSVNNYVNFICPVISCFLLGSLNKAAQNSSGRTSFLLTCPPEFSCFFSSSRSLYLIVIHQKFLFFQIVAGDLAGVDRWILVHKQRQEFNFSDSSRPVWLSKDDEWVSGGWSRWAALGKQIPSLSCHLCSAGTVGVLLWERHVHPGRELSTQRSRQCRYSTFSTVDVQCYEC